jgi:hypothetical protein
MVRGKKKSNTNVMEYMNPQKVAEDFIKYYYHTWTTNPMELRYRDIIRPHSKLVHQKTEHHGDMIMQVLVGLSKENIVLSDIKYQATNGGTRRVDILVTGNNRKNKFKRSAKNILSKFHIMLCTNWMVYTKYNNGYILI